MSNPVKAEVVSFFLRNQKLYNIIYIVYLTV